MRLLLVAFVSAAAAALAATPVDGIVMVREIRMDVVRQSMDFQYDAYVLFRGGAMHRGIPSGAPSAWDVDMLRRGSPNLVGKWSESGTLLRLTNAAGESKEHKEWFRMSPGKTGERLDGTWWHASSVTQQVADSKFSASSLQQVLLSPDGNFEWKRAGGASRGTDSGSVVAASRQDSTGQYRIDGWEIEFRFADGRLLRTLFCGSSDERNTILLGEARLIRRKR